PSGIPPGEVVSSPSHILPKRAGWLILCYLDHPFLHMIPDTTRFWIQFEKHRESIDYLQSNLDKFPEARRLGIEIPVPIDEIRWVLKVSDSAPDEALEIIRRAYEAHGFPVEIYKVPWGKGK
ncbi:hypothetical protein AB1399_06685, partial [Hydrogenibacillus schlegelii]|uniref:hypothetical protein n=1 Tax=Hydrogenibacillus schlegelii TaxID=1484 RepID=UPI0034A02D99